MKSFLGVNIEIQVDGTINLMQPNLMDQIVIDLHLSNEKLRIRDTTDMLSKVLKRHSGSELHEWIF